MADHLNFILFPFMAPGHTIPMINIANLLSNHTNVTVTIILTHLYATRFASLIQSGPSIRLLNIRFPTEQAGLPPGCESADTLPSHHFLPNFSTAIKMLQPSLEEMLNQLNPSPSCIICDKLITWTVDTCNDLQIPRIVFDGMSCFTQVVMHNLYISKIYQTVPPNVPFIVPCLPDGIELTRLQLPGLFNPGPKHVPGFRERVRETESLAYGVVVNTFEEVEKRYVDEFKKLRGGKVWCVGPLLSHVSCSSIDSNECLKWLDNRESESVVYACFGSLSSLSPPQFIKLALGLEASNHPFILVIKRGSKSEEIEKWISDEGIEERIKDRGLLVRGWAPQVEILSHEAVGAFLTHCGWNSALEGMCAGLPMITWPLFSEQFLNEKLIVQIVEIGVRVGAKGVVHIGEEEKAENKVMSDEINGAIERVMGKGKEGTQRRKRAKEIGEKAKRAVEKGGSSCLNVELLIQDIRQLLAEKQEMKS